MFYFMFYFILILILVGTIQQGQLLKDILEVRNDDFKVLIETFQITKLPYDKYFVKFINFNQKQVNQIISLVYLLFQDINSQ
jgi:hypothetical protein